MPAPIDPARLIPASPVIGQIGSLRECLNHYTYEARVGYGVDLNAPAYRVAVEAVEYHLSRAADRAWREPEFAAAHVEAGLAALDRLGGIITDYGDPIEGEGV